MIDEELFRKFTESTLQAPDEANLRSYGIKNATKFRALHHMLADDANGGEYKITEISRYTQMRMPNVTRMLNEMQMDGLITRRREGRQVFVRVTDKGREFHEKGLERLRERQKRVMDELAASDVTDEEINEFMRTAIKLREITNSLGKEGLDGRDGPLPL